MSNTRAFQVTLPSNVNVELFKDNSPSNYITQLSNPVNLDGKWEVALVDLLYPLNWFNLRRSIPLYFLAVEELGDDRAPIDMSIIDNMMKGGNTDQVKNNIAYCKVTAPATLYR